MMCPVRDQILEIDTANSSITVTADTFVMALLTQEKDIQQQVVTNASFKKDNQPNRSTSTRVCFK